MAAGSLKSRPGPSPPAGGGPACSACGTGMSGRYCHECGVERKSPSAAECPSVNGRVALIEPLGDDMDVYMKTDSGHGIVGRIEADAQIEEGQELRMFIDMRGVHLFKTGEAGTNVTAACLEDRVGVH